MTQKDDSPLLVYITVPDADEAGRIARALVEARLAAGVNRLDGARSVYRWQGEICEAQECVLFAQTQADRLDDLIRLVRSLHSHEVPCIVAMPLTGGNPDFLQWIFASTRP